MHHPGSSSSVAPALETDRLVLRVHRLDDLAACAAMWADPLVTRHIGGKPSTPQATWLRMLRYPGLWALLGFGYWAVEEKATGAFVADVGFADLSVSSFHRSKGSPNSVGRSQRPRTAKVLPPRRFAPHFAGVTSISNGRKRCASSPRTMLPRFTSPKSAVTRSAAYDVSRRADDSLLQSLAADSLNSQSGGRSLR